MWVRDQFVREILAVQQQETERYGLLAEIRRQERRGEDGGAWRWRIEAGMEEAFGDLQDWLLSSEQVKDLPEEALSSLGCCNPTAVAGLKEGEHVLDLGSGGGLDCFLAAQKVGPKGKAVGLDMTPDMVELARRNAGKVGLSNVEFHQGDIGVMPFPDASFDVIISNCVINLSPDKDAVFRESFRVLKPGGRFRVWDIVWLRAPTEKERSDLESWAGCVAGALMVGEYVAKLSAAGFSDVRTRLADDGGDRGFTSAYVEAEKPVGDAAPRASCCEPEGAPTAAEAVAGTAGEDTGPGCGCGAEGR